MDELRFSVSSRKQGAVVLQQVSVVLPTQNTLLYFLLDFCIFVFVKLPFSYGTCISITHIALYLLTYLSQFRAVPFFPSLIPHLFCWSPLWCGTCSAGDGD